MICSKEDVLLRFENIQVVKFEGYKFTTLIFVYQYTALTKGQSILRPDAHLQWLKSLTRYASITTSISQYQSFG